MQASVHPIHRQFFRGGWFFLSAFLVAVVPPARAAVEADTDFPGGSGEIIEGVENGRTVLRLDPADHPGKGWRCWWHVKLRGLKPGEPLVLDVGEAPWATPDQAAYSIDGGATWLQTEKGLREGKRIRYTLNPPAPALEVAWGPPLCARHGHELVN
jgi:hypothetical protein